MPSDNSRNVISHLTNIPVSNVYMFTKEQIEVYTWLKAQKLNTDDDTLNYWSRKYPFKRIMEVVNFAQERQKEGQHIRNIGGWIHKLLMSGFAVVTDECKINREFTQGFIEINKWANLAIYEKYVKDI